jgi:hypothetical protein
MKTEEVNVTDPNLQAATQLKLEIAIRSGADWFYWIAGLSILNSIIQSVGGGFTFIFGLGITQAVDAIISIFREEINHSYLPVLSTLNIILDLSFVVLFVVLGFIARKKYRWAFIVGLLMYGLDGLLVLWAKDYLAAGFHIIAGIGIYRGIHALSDLQALPSEMLLNSKEVAQLMSNEPQISPEERKENFQRFLRRLAIPLAILLLALIVTLIFIS